MMIQVLKHFDNGRIRIKPDTYSIDDKRLRNMGGYLLSEGIAIRVETEPPATVADEPQIDDPTDYASMTKETLLAYVGDDLDSIEGTGSRGNVLHSDLVAWLEANR